MTAAAPGVLRRPRADVPETLMHPVTVFRPVRDHGQYVVDASFDACREIDDHAAEVRQRLRRIRRRK